MLKGVFNMIKKVACVGILVADVIVEPVIAYPEKGVLEKVNSITVHNGGNAMTASINLRKLGVESKMVGMVGDDMFGQFLRERLEKADVDTRGLKVSDRDQTSASVLMIDKNAERSFFHCVGTNAVFGIDDIDFSIIEECDIVFVTGTFLLTHFDGEETMLFLKKCKEMGKTTMLDVCWDANGNWGKLLDMCMPYIDYLMPSIDEAVCIAGKEEPDEIADVFNKNGAKNVIIKLFIGNIPLKEIRRNRFLHHWCKRLKVFCKVNIFTCTNRNITTICNFNIMFCVMPWSNIFNPCNVVFFKTFCKHNAVFNANMTEMVDCKRYFVSYNISYLFNIIFKIIHAFLC